jgi:hypothetical protein
VPAIIIGADTPLGSAIASGIDATDREVRAFVSDPATSADLRALGINTAVGDVSDGSHISAAASGCFTAIIDPTMALDVRERSFSTSPDTTILIWGQGLQEAGVTRIIWLQHDAIPSIPASMRTSSPEFVVIATHGQKPSSVAAEVFRIDDLDEIAKV